MQSTFIRAFLSIDAVRKYEKDNSPEDYKEKLRRLFAKKSTFGGDLFNAMKYKKNADSVEDFFNTIEKLTQKVFSHKIDEKSFKTYLFENALNDIEMLKEVKINGINNLSEAKERLIKIEEIRKEIMVEPEISVIKRQSRSYAQVTKNYNTERQPQRYQYVDNQSGQQRRPKPTLHEEQMRTERRSHPQAIRCWACRQMGHIRRDCPNVTCSHCKRRGHFHYQCYDLHPNRRMRRNVAEITAHSDERDEQRENGPEILTPEYPKGSAPLLEEVVGAMVK